MNGTSDVKKPCPMVGCRKSNALIRVYTTNKKQMSVTKKPDEYRNTLIVGIT